MAEARHGGTGGFFDTEERVRCLSALGDPLERLSAVVDFDAFKAELEAALPRADRSRTSRDPRAPNSLHQRLATRLFEVSTCTPPRPIE